MSRAPGESSRRRRSRSPRSVHRRDRSPPRSKPIGSKSQDRLSSPRSGRPVERPGQPDDVPAGLSVGRDAQGQMQVAVSVKATFTWDRRGTVTPVDAAPLREKDELEGEGMAAGLAAAAEISPPKPRVDVLLAGELVFRAPITESTSRSASGAGSAKSCRSWASASGSRAAEKSLPPPARRSRRLPISWTRAFGGCDPSIRRSSSRGTPPAAAS